MSGPVEGMAGDGPRRRPFASDSGAFGPIRGARRGPRRSPGTPSGWVGGREAAGSLWIAIREVARVGDDAQRQAARTVVVDAVRSLWSILAQGPTAPSARPTEDIGAGEPSDTAGRPDDPAQWEAGVPTDAGTEA